MIPLRLVTCGSVDDGKSTLIGRLLYDCGLVPQDQLAELKRDSTGRPVGPEGLDFSLLVDGLAAEREQGITIDVAYRYFATAKRSVILADAPGHEQYTRNFATAASNARAALVLVDARKGVVAQTSRHTVILSLMGVRRVALIVNKMDLVAEGEAAFRDIAESFREFADRLGLVDVTAIPASAVTGANVAKRDKRMAWYAGPTLLEWLETPFDESETHLDVFRMPVQWVNRASSDFRGVAGTIAHGRVRAGDAVGLSGSSRTATVARIATMDGDKSEAIAGDAVTLVLDQNLDAGRGSVVFAAAAPPEIADQFAANLVWLDDAPLLPHREYLLKIGSDTVPAEITALKYRYNIDSLVHEAVKTLEANDIGVCNIATARPVVVESFRQSRSLGSFILIDKQTRATVGAGMIEFPLRRASNLAWQRFDLDRAARAAQKRQKPAIVWFTGLSGSGKSTIANLVDRRLHALGRHTFVLDGDNVRHGLNKDLGFTDADRIENVRRVANVAQLMADAGLIVLVSLISPFARDRLMARNIAGEVRFIEIFVDAPLAVCIERDPKGLYAKVKADKIEHFTGFDSGYERPTAPDLHLHSDTDSIDDCVERVLEMIEAR